MQVAHLSWMLPEHLMKFMPLGQVPQHNHSAKQSDTSGDAGGTLNLLIAPNVAVHH